jgi:hypothetical protein
VVRTWHRECAGVRKGRIERGESRVVVAVESEESARECTGLAYL